MFERLQHKPKQFLATSRYVHNSLWIMLAVLLAAGAIGGAAATAGVFTPGETCENPIFAGGPGGTSQQYTICFDQKEVFGNIVVYRAGINSLLRFGLKSTGPTIKVANGGGGGGQPILQVFTEPTAGLPQGTVTVFGTIGWISDTVPTIVMNGNSNGQNLEELRLDTATGLLKNDLPDSYNLSSAPPGTVRNSTYTLSWLGRAQLAAMAAGAITDTTKLDMVFDLHNKLFTGTLPFPLKVAGELQNPSLIITPSVTFDPNGFKYGSIKDFTANLGGFELDVRNVSYVTGTFTAGQVDVLKSKNQAYAALGTQPGNSNLLFGFTGFKYTTADHKFSIQGGDIGIREFSFGNKVKLTNNRIGVLYDTPTGKTYATIKTTLQFPNHLQTTTSVTSVVLFGRKLFTQTGQIERYFEGGVADFTGKIGPLNLNLKQARVVGDQVSDFYGITADAITVKWDSIIGDGQSGAGMTGFKLGAKADGTVQFSLNGGVVQLPQVQNGLFKGTGIVGTVSVLSETVTFTGTTTLSIKTAGGSKNAGGFAFNPVMSIILRAGPTVQDTCPANAPAGCLRKVDGRVDDFSIGIASFKFRLAGVRPLGDGGFAVQTATLGVPAFLSALAGGGNNLALASNSFNTPNSVIGPNGMAFADADWLALTNAHDSRKGPLAALPPGPSITVNGFQYKGDGSFTVAGGVIEMPPLKLGDYKLGGAKLGFLREVVSDTLFYTAIGGVTIGLGDLDTGSTSLTGQLTIRTKKDFGSPGIGDFDKLDVAMALTFPNPGVPIIPPILTLDSLGAAASLSEQQKVFTATVGIGTIFQVGPFDLVRLNGVLGIQAKPFLMRGQFNPKLLNFIDLSDTTFELGNGAGFMSCPPGQSPQIGTAPNVTPNPNCGPGKGFHMHSYIRKLIAFGDIDLRFGTVNGAVKIQGTAGITVGIAKDTFFGLPRDPISLIDVSFQLGKFHVPYKSAETLGAMGTLNVTNNFRPTLFIDFAEDCCFGTLQGALGTPTGKLFNFGINTDGYTFINTALVQQQLARKAEGYRMALVSRENASGLAPEAPSEAPSEAPVAQLTIPIPITKTGGAMVAFTYSSTVAPAPSIRIVTPGNVTVTPANAAANGFEYKSSPDAVNTDLIFYFVSTPGTYQLIIDDVPATYDINTLVLNNPPTVNNLSITGGRLINFTNISWNAADVDSSEARVKVFYARVYSGTASADLGSMLPIAEDLPLGNGSAVWDRTHVQSGVYKVVVQAYDGKNPPVNLIQSNEIVVVNTAPPAVPSGITANSLPNQLLLKWDKNTEPDIAGYEIGFALVPDANQMLYTRDVGTNEIYTGALAALSGQAAAPVPSVANKFMPDSFDAPEATSADQTDAKLWMPADGDTVYYAVRARDLDGNTSAWSPMTAGATWPLSPKAYTPAPNGSGQTVIEVGFAAALNPATLSASSITLFDANNAQVPGSTSLVYAADETSVVGLRFTPKNAVAAGRYQGRVAGGDSGIASTDGRRMPANFVWSFNFNAAQPPTFVYLPMLAK